MPSSLPPRLNTTVTTIWATHHIRFDPDHTSLSLPFKLITITTLHTLHHQQYILDRTPPPRLHTIITTISYHYRYHPDHTPQSLSSRPHTTIITINTIKKTLLPSRPHITIQTVHNHPDCILSSINQITKPSPLSSRLQHKHGQL